MSAIKNIIRGDNHNIVVTFLEDDGSTAINLTGGTVFFTVSANDVPTDDTDALITKSVTSHTTPLSGITTIALLPADTDVTPGEYWYDVQFVDQDDNVVSKKRDKFTIIGDITRRVV
jgi:hypothetical protein